MKRTVLFALVGIIALAFASCGENQSKEFTEKKAAIESLTTEVAGVSACDAIEALSQKFDEITSKTYEEADAMNETEQGTLSQIIEQAKAAIDGKIAEFCTKDETPAEEANVELDENGNPILDAAEAAVEQTGEAIQEGVEAVTNEVKDAIQG